MSDETTDLKSQLESLQKENDTLRGLLGNSSKPCPYCGLAAEDQIKCALGFPGCSRADDQMLGRYFADAYCLQELEKDVAELLKLRPFDEYHEDKGDVLWWKLPIEEPPWVGSPLSMDWPGYHTHWSHLPNANAPDALSLGGSITNEDTFGETPCKDNSES